MNFVHNDVTTLTRGGLADATGCNPETIRYYEKMGLIPKPPRSGAGYRIYRADHVRHLRFVMRARALGFSMDDIRGLLSLAGTDQRTCDEVRQRTEHHLSAVRSKIADLQRIEALLSETAARCSDPQVPDCPILDVLNTDGTVA